MADAKTINGYNLKDAAAREAIANLNTVKLASEGGASGSIRFGVDANGKYGYFEAGADTVTPFSSGGDFEETVLWTNSNPTSQMISLTISNLPDLSQFDYIGLYCRWNISNSNEIVELMPYDIFKLTSWANAKRMFGVSLRGTDNIHMRTITYVSDTSIQINPNYYISFTSLTGGQFNETLIPIKITGIKKGNAVYPKPIRVMSARDSAGYCHGEVHFDVTDYTSVTFTVHVSGNNYFTSSGGTRVQGTYTDDISNITDFWIGAYTYTNDYYSVITYIDSIKFS